MAALNVLELFAGIGGLSLGLERAGMTVVGQVESDPFCRAVLSRHWPEVPRHDDVRTAVDWWWSCARPAVHVVAGGYPCQPFSSAGRQGGIADERWGWPWMFDVVRAVRPRYVLVENVAALLDDADAFGWMLGDLASLGFDARWSVLSACAVGAPHVRERLFVVAYADGIDGAPGLGRHQYPGASLWSGHWSTADSVHPADGFLEAARRSRRVADGLPDRLEPARVRALGNAVVPQVAEHIGRLITSHTNTITDNVRRAA